MAQGLSSAREQADTVGGTTSTDLDTTVLTPTAGSRIVSVFVKKAAPEVRIIGIASDATGDTVTVTWKCRGLEGAVYPVVLTVFEVTDV